MLLQYHHTIDIVLDASTAASHFIVQTWGYS